jgi:hypothetical protein
MRVLINTFQIKVYTRRVLTTPRVRAARENTRGVNVFINAFKF